MATTIVAGKKLLETALVNTATKYFPFPFKPNRRRKNVSLLCNLFESECLRCV
jgi:hypothetical protein